MLYIYFNPLPQTDAFGHCCSRQLLKSLFFHLKRVSIFFAKCFKVGWCRFAVCGKRLTFYLCTCTSEFNRELEKDIISDTSGSFKKLMVSLVQANRSDGKEVDRNKANQDAKELYQVNITILLPKVDNFCRVVHINIWKHLHI